MLNVVLQGFESKYTTDVLLRLQDEQIINIIKWYYEPNKQTKRLDEDPAACNQHSLWRSEWPKVKKYPDENFQKKILAQMDWLMQEYARDTEFIREYFYEYKNLMWQLIHVFYQDLYNKHIDLVFFQDIPHGNFSATLYAVARAMGIETLFLAGIGPYPDRFNYAHTIDDYGEFKYVPEYRTTTNICRIEKAFYKELDYMSPERIQEELGTGWRRKLKAILNPKLWIDERKHIWNKNFEKYDSLYDFAEHKLISNITKRVRTKIYDRNLQKNSIKNVDLNRKYIYFPLHLQPEMTTDTIGGMYRDQLLAIEKISTIIPEDCYIYVKENPKQLFLTRSKFFFKRLFTIKNALLVDRSVNTYDLMRNSQFVATITGTAGWEAITGGKPVVIFGRIWYENFPGVFRYNDSLSFTDVVNYNINHENIEKKLAELQRKTCKGLWRQYDIEHAANIDYNKNAANLYESFYFLLTTCK